MVKLHIKDDFKTSDMASVFDCGPSQIKTFLNTPIKFSQTHKMKPSDMKGGAFFLWKGEGVLHLNTVKGSILDLDLHMIESFSLQTNSTAGRYGSFHVGGGPLVYRSMG